MFAMNGYMPQTIQVSIRESAEHSILTSAPPDLVPNPVEVELQTISPPPKPAVKVKLHANTAKSVVPQPTPRSDNTFPASPPASQDPAFPPPPPFRWPEAQGPT
jgi:hypothetical protein